jgi:hexosaminidase
MPNEKIGQFRTFPRLCATAETGWSLKEKKNYANFRTRLNFMLKRFDILGIHYAPASIFEPSIIKRIIANLKTPH